ncbi:MAG: hypothetical protein RJA70_1603 [Pseudomonadota bacterium]|jgi:alginate O-acetyltransferase complex protein AlgI
MLFFDGLFFVFLAVTIAASSLAFSSVRARTWVLLIASYLFYGAWDWRFCGLILFSTTLDYFVALGLEGATQARKRQLMVASLIVNLGTLAIFKYLDFGIGSLNSLFNADIPLLELVLPVGISFFTFQSMSYTIDVYRGEIQAEKNFASFALFVSFFPQLVAGPIIRASDYLPQVTAALSKPLHRAAGAAPLFVFGLFKKVVIADHLGAVVDAVYADPAAFSSGDRWLATAGFAGQIYCDFSGYTDMALALCAIFGFAFPLNFRSPYLARGPQEFWRRWHISLSTWLRDYLYVPLGGSKHGKGRMLFALGATMLLGGFWHGASWTFVLWGAFHGTLLVAERVFMRPSVTLSRWDIVRWPVFFVLTLIGWMIFRAQSLDTLRLVSDGLWSWQAPKRVPVGLVGLGLLWVALDHVISEANRKHQWTLKHPWLHLAAAGVVLPFCFIMRPDHSAEFIYFQF